MYSVVDVSFCMIGAFSWGIQDFLLAVAIRNIITQSVVYIKYIRFAGPINFIGPANCIRLSINQGNII